MTAICEVCLDKVPSQITYRDDGVWLEKQCPTHGPSEHLVEPDVEFYRLALSQEKNPAVREVWAKMFTTTGLDVTRRCNVRCPHCYVEPDNRVKDIERADLVALAKSAVRSDSIILMGAEPTMRNDLAELIADIKQETGKSVGVYTNAIRLANERYANEVFAAGLDYACVSLHTPSYLPDPKLFDKKIEGISNLVKAGVPIHHISFSLRSIDELDGVLGDALALRHTAGHIRIRSPQQVGVCEDEPMHLSDLYNRVVGMLEAAGHTVALVHSDNTPYHVNLLVDGCQVFRLIRWPTLATADLEALDCPPYALFDRESGEVNLVLSFLLQEARRNKPPAIGARISPAHA
ncbi:radical SAM protein [Alcaligenaceae bacterium]|nr:radical SAM protein [Alcaligenaceae bacterium]